MKEKISLNTVLFISIFVITLLLTLQFLRTPYYSTLNIYVQKNIIFYSVLLYLIKVVGIVWPPIPGGIFTLASIPFLGWKLAFIIDLLGSTTGATIAYYLGYKYGYNFLKKIFGKNIAIKIKTIKIKKGKEIEAIIMYKLLLGGVILEAICYGAGVLKINFKIFLIGSILAHIFIGIPSFYFTHNLLLGKNIISTIAVASLALIVLFKTKGRYFE